ncbi:MAG TPA: chemotaxis response regulator protein-glutamate methylesterase [Steroidobacteraceae bacterium]|nr:chemotaxis response regulator protein-glutamate methylesterase [Steroidobacteraceae bacterium]
MTTTSNKKIKVLIVDDSALVRQLLSEIFAADPGLEVVGTAQDAYMAREKIKRFNPDVLTLDVEMPKMDGIQFLRNLMRLRPMPVVMCSSLTERGADVTLDALALGAVDFVTKPKVDLAYRLEDYAQDIIAKVKAASRARVRALAPGDAAAAAPAPHAIKIVEKLSADAVLPRSAQPRHFRTTDQIVAIGASTGGTEAIREVLVRLPPDAPGIVITQHIPKAFSGPFAARMNSCSALTVCEARDGQQILPGHVFIAPGDLHLLVVRDGAQYRCRLNDGPPVQRHKPSVDVLLRSVAQNAGPNAIGVMLTGMGRDGAEGMKEMRDAGAACIAQDEATSVVWGMPGAAYEAGAAETLHPLHSIAGKIMQLVGERSGAHAA